MSFYVIFLNAISVTLVTVSDTSRVTFMTAEARCFLIKLIN